MSLADRLRGIEIPKKPERKTPVWKGPEEDGITFSLLSRFLVCRERFRCLVVEGLRPDEGFNHRIEYGQMWHCCEEALADGGLDPLRQLKAYASGLAKQYPTQLDQVEHWYNVCKVQFPLYVRYWEKHPDVLARQPLLAEQSFNVPYRLPSGRVVRLRGKWDSVDLVWNPSKGNKSGGIWLQENKSKGDVREVQLRRQLTFDLQTMIYLVALDEDQDGFWQLVREKYPGKGRRPFPLRGVRYNVVRRPLSGGAGSIKRHKPTKSNPAGESKEEFYDRLRGIIEESPETYFMRWLVEVTPGDIKKFRQQCLDPILEQLCDWWGWIRVCREEHSPFTSHENGIHWRHPFGVFNPLDEGGGSDLDEYLASGSEVGLKRIDNLFPELT